MCALDPSLDTANDEQTSKFIDADTRNHLAFIELKQYEQTKTFAYLHPLLQAYKLEVELNQLRTTNPEKFMKDLINCDKNIARYQSQINNNKYRNADELAGWQAIIKDSTNRLSIMKSLISK